VSSSSRSRSTSARAKRFRHMLRTRERNDIGAP
jgi:hypothetical protein